MICPACREEMIVVEYNKIELDVCVQCNGVWFDAEELSLLLETLDLRVDELGHTPPEKTAERARKCPCCRKRMDKVMIGPGQGVMIDRCTRGHGLWFDGGELDGIVNALQTPDGTGGTNTEKSQQVGSFLKEVLLAERESGKS